MYLVYILCYFFFLCKRKTSYEIRISDWSSDVCSSDLSIRHLLAVIDDSDTSDCVRSERAFLLGLGAGCHSPVAALARIEDEGIFLKAEILSIDGTEHV